MSLRFAPVLALLLSACTAHAPPATTTTTATPPAQATITRVDPSHLDAVLREVIAQGKAVGLSALIVQLDREVYFGAFGFADREAGRAMTRDTLAQIWSMTKPVTGVVLMTLYEEGRFALDDPLSKYLPEYADVRVYDGVDAAGEPRTVAPQRPILVRDILRHTAGFSSESDPSPAREAFLRAKLDDRTRTLAQLSELVAAMPLAFQPGTRWLYGPSVDIQARLAERLAGKPYAQLLQERVLDPLRMHETAYVVPAAQRARLAAVYELKDGAFVRIGDEAAFANVTRAGALTPGGYGLVSTLDDYARFARMLLGGGELDGVRILQSATVEAMATDLLSTDITERSWLPSKGQVGFGIDVAVRHSPPADAKEASGAVGEFFWDGYANTLFWVDPKNELVAVLFTQYIPPSGTDLFKRFRDAVYVHDAEASSAARATPSR
jgi:CubicO group peptidase (beta-lactamase class C family)